MTQKAKRPGLRDVPNSTKPSNAPRTADTSEIEALDDVAAKLRAYADEIRALPYSHNEQRRFSYEVLPLLIDMVVGPAPEVVEVETDDAPPEA